MIDEIGCEEVDVEFIMSDLVSTLSYSSIYGAKGEQLLIVSLLEFLLCCAFSE